MVPVMKKAVILLSGGLDSTTLLFYVKHQLNAESIHALSFDYGQKHSRELEAARWQADKAGVHGHTIIDISFFKGLVSNASALTDEHVPVPSLAELDSAQRNQPPTYVPNRNMVLLSLAAAHAEANDSTDVFYGAQLQDEYGYWDCTPEFLQNMNKVFSLNRRKAVVLHAPFMNMNKAGVLKQGLALGVDYSHTWSCYRGESSPCGTCPTCVERAKAFSEIGVTDPLCAQ